MKSFLFLLKYIRYWFTASTKYDIHSPYVFALVTDVINKQDDDARFKEIESLRRKLKKDHTEIEVTDFGMGGGGSKKRKISHIASASAKPPKYARLLHRIVKHYQPKYLLELGTSLGISAMYQASAVPNANLVTIEGCGQTALWARRNFDEVELENISVAEGNLNEVLGKVLNEMPQLDYVFFDGNHQEEATIRYFEQCLKKKHDNSIFIFDDIHWSVGMEKAWQYIVNHPEVVVTVDLFMIGVVIFKRDLAKQKFSIRY